MIRNLKTLGLTAFAMLALGAMFASAASAQSPGVLTAGDTDTGAHTETPIHGVQYGSITENDFVAFVNQKLTCTNQSVSFTGTASGTDKTTTITPTYEDCYVFDENHAHEFTATVTMNGCDYQFNQPHSVGESHTTWTGTVDLVCPEGNQVVIHIYTGNPHTHSGFRVCRETLPPQKGIGTVEYHNIAADEPGEFDDITVTVRGKGIKASRHGLCGSASDENAEYTSNVTLTSDTDDLWISTE